MAIKIAVNGARYVANITFRPDFHLESASEGEIAYLLKTLQRILDALDSEDGKLSETGEFSGAPTHQWANNTGNK